jgi:hypothetical protein
LVDTRPRTAIGLFGRWRSAAAELAVGDDVEAEVNLPRDGRAHLLGDDLIGRRAAGRSHLEQPPGA